MFLSFPLLHDNSAVIPRLSRLPKTIALRHIEVSHFQGHVNTTCSGLSLIVTNQPSSITSYAVVNTLPNSRQWDGKRELFAPEDNLPNHTHEVTANR